MRNNITLSIEHSNASLLQLKPFIYVTYIESRYENRADPNPSKTEDSDYLIMITYHHFDEKLCVHQKLRILQFSEFSSAFAATLPAATHCPPGSGISYRNVAEQRRLSSQCAGALLHVRKRTKALPTGNIDF